jgi:hypothetical protein
MQQDIFLRRFSKTYWGTESETRDLQISILVDLDFVKNIHNYTEMITGTKSS